MPTPTSEPTGLADPAINTEESDYRRWIPKATSVLILLLVMAGMAAYARYKPPG